MEYSGGNYEAFAHPEKARRRRSEMDNRCEVLCGLLDAAVKLRDEKPLQ